MTRRDWPWLVRAYYGDNATPPRTPGEFSIEIGGLSKEALALDVLCLEKDPEIGTIIGPFEVSVFTSSQPPARI